MGINFGSFVGGLAKSLDERLQDDMRRTAERSDRVREYHVTRATRKQERFEEEQKELQEVLENLSNYMDKAGIEIPEGMTKADFAAQLYTTGGGTLSSGKKLVADLATHYDKKGDIKGLIKQASLVTKGKGFGDYINNFVRRPESMIKIPEGLKGGTGFLKDVDITKGIQTEMDTMFKTDPQAEKFDVKGLGLDRSKMVGAQEYALSMEKETIGLEQAKANLNETLLANKQKGAIDKTQVNKDFNTMIKTASKAKDIPVKLDGLGNVVGFDLKPTSEKYTDLQNIYKDSLRFVTENAKETGALNMPGMESTLKTLAIGSLYYNKAIVAKQSDYIVGNIYRTKKGSILWTGDDKTSPRIIGKY